ncbi:MAG: hypothetical protein JO368_10270, partial [Acidimicrobiales bacterium]|nr:hypothetical protein [Acidimicrobiales bacterium]
GHFWRWPALLAVGCLVVLAGPWWLVSGHSALHYLLNAGYNPSSGYLTSPHGFEITLPAIHHRISYELSELGWSESWVLGIALVAAVVGGVLNRRRIDWRSLWMLAVWSVLTLLLLSSSSNLGTAFGLPVLVVVIVLCGGVLGQLPLPALRWALLPLGVVLAVGFALQFTSSTSEWWPGPTYRSQVVNAGATSRTDVGMIVAQLAHEIGGSRTLLVLNDPIVNANGLAWELDEASSVQVPSGGSETAEAIGELPRARAIITGTNLSSSFDSVDPAAVERAALAAGFRPARLWRVGTAGGVILWRRGAAPSVSHIFPPATTVAKPKTSGTVVKGVYDLNASATALFGLRSVKFEISGGTPRREIVLAAYLWPGGWLGFWVTTDSPDGVYTIRSVAEDLTGQTARSAPVLVHVDN